MASTTADKPLILRDAADSLSVSVMFVLVLTVFQRSVGFVRKWIFCGCLAPDELGQWDLVFGFLTLAAAFSVFGLPGALLRFVEFFRKEGQLRSYVQLTLVATGLLGIVSVLLMLVYRERFAQLFLGESDFQYSVLCIAIVLATTIAFNTLVTYFTAMKCQRLRSWLAAAYTLAFTVIGAALLIFWQATATSVIFAHCASLVLCLCIGAYWVGSSNALSATNVSVGHIGPSFVRKVVPFAIAVWVTNALANLFPLVDRYMVVNFSGQDAETAFGWLGQYHVARLVPVFSVSLAQMLQATLLPYLSRDWEAGNHVKVRDRLDSFLRVFGVAFYGAAGVFLLLGPQLITALYGEKYQLSLSVLNLALLCGLLTSLFILAQSYLWCAQKGWTVNIGLAIALCVIVGLSAAFLPRFGLPGAVAASCVGTLVLLIYTVACCGLYGMRFHPGTSIVVLLPFTLLAGPVVTAVTLGGVGITVWKTNLLLTNDDRRQAKELMQRIMKRTAPDAASSGDQVG